MPRTSEAIKDWKFAIIDGQHCVQASIDLHSEKISNARKVDLESWNAYIVYDRDSARLTAISEFYNTTNLLKHAHPT